MSETGRGRGIESDAALFRRVPDRSVVLKAIAHARPNALRGGKYILISRETASPDDDLFEPHYIIAGSTDDIEQAKTAVKGMNQNGRRVSFLVEVNVALIPVEEESLDSL